MSTSPSALTTLALSHLAPLLSALPKAGCIVGVSGGPDSVFLLHLLKASRYFKHLLVAHVNYGLRGNESDGDAVFVKTLADELGVDSVFWKEHELFGTDPQQISGMEAKAREIRYHFFQRLASEQGQFAVFVGHTENDQVETILMNFIRGAGARGLSGMQAISTQRPNPALPAITLLRPLLHIGKELIQADLLARGIRFRIDSSNFDLDYRRNKLRHDIIPRLLEINPALPTTLQRTSDVLAQEHADQHARVDQLMQAETLFRQKSKIEYWLNQSELLKYATSDKRALILFLLKTLSGDAGEIGFDHVSSALALAESGKASGRVSLPGQTEAETSKGTLILRNTAGARVKPKAKPKQRPLSIPGKVLWPTGQIAAKRLDQPEAVATVKQQLLLERKFPALTTAYLDADQVGSLMIRTRSPGDRFYPFGLDGSKKIQDLYVDAKLPVTDRDVYPLIVDGKEPLWIPGLAVSDHAKVTLDTKVIIQLDYTPTTKSP